MTRCSYYNCFHESSPLNAVPHPGAFKHIIAPPNNPQFLSCFFSIYICPLNHCSVVCLKCWGFHSLDNSGYHIMKCYNWDIEHGPDRVVQLDSGDINVRFLRSVLPQSTCLRLNYNDREIVNLLKNDERFVKPRVIYSEDVIMWDIANLMLKQSVNCSICGLYYDCFPTESQVISHLKKCIP